MKQRKTIIKETIKQLENKIMIDLEIVLKQRQLIIELKKELRKGGD